MMRVFVLSHTHSMPDGSADWKLLGIFADRESADSARIRAAERPGFAEAVDGFEVSEFPVLKSGGEPADDNSEVHLLFRQGDHPDHGEVIRVIGAFDSEQAGEEAGLTITDLESWEGIEVHPYDVGVESWLEGYTTIVWDEQ